jgi:hypothetical protein
VRNTGGVGQGGGVTCNAVLGCCRKKTEQIKPLPHTSTKNIACCMAQALPGPKPCAQFPKAAQLTDGNCRKEIETLGGGIWYHGECMCTAECGVGHGASRQERMGSHKFSLGVEYRGRGAKRERLRLMISRIGTHYATGSEAQQRRHGAHLSTGRIPDQNVRTTCRRRDVKDSDRWALSAET